ILPALGKYFVDAIETQDIVQWRDQLPGQPDTVNGYLAVLKNLFADMTEELDLPRNPAARIKKVRKPHSEESNRLTAAELRRYLEYFREAKPKHYPIALILCQTGMRWGEASALRVEDIDEGEMIIHVRRSHSYGVVDTTKTGPSRTGIISDELRDVLRAHRVGLMKVNHPGYADGWLFQSETGRLRRSDYFRRHHLQALQAIGVERRVTIHGLRRTFNNIMRQVAPADVVRSMTGHVTEQMTYHYSHVEIEEKRVACQGFLRLVHCQEVAEKVAV
ncbi:MAG: tyrosine-type recombinase/integrase, partial [Myxococcales bacterium]|nr:tyrosine-type recombinase/integrase [Myxococcales bacterium]